MRAHGGGDRLAVRPVALVLTLAALAAHAAAQPYDPPRGDTRFVVLGDFNGPYGSTTYPASLARVIAAVTEVWRPDAVLFPGDVVAGQSRELSRERLDAMWRAFDEHVAAPLRAAGIAYALAVGNHDASSPLVTAERREWLAAQLASEPARQAAVRIVVGHLPLVPVSVGREAPGERLAAAEEIAALLREGCVSAYVSGHHAAYYPGVWDGLELLAAGGIGARRLLGWDGRPRSTVTVVDVWEAAGELTYATFDVETLEPLGGEDLPAALPGGVTLSARAYGKPELAANAARTCQAPTLADG